MNLRKHILFLALLICLITPFALYAEESEQTNPVSYRYDTGDQLFFFDAGLYRPLFILAPGQNSVYESIIDNTYLGGNASMGFEAFYNHQVSFGVEIGYTFSYAKDNNLYTAVPLSANVSYYLLQGDIDLPISLGAGIVYNSFADESYLSPIFLKPQIGLVWNFNDNWGVGLDLDYWFVSEFYMGDNAEKTTYLNSASARITLQYKQ